MRLRKIFPLIVSFVWLVLFASSVNFVFGADCGGENQPSCNIGGSGQQGLTSEERAAGAVDELPDAESPNDCVSKVSNSRGNQVWQTPSNCLFLDEPIGGKPGYDLYVRECGELNEGPNKAVCVYRIWTGGQLLPNEYGPLQAVLTREAGKEYQGPFGLLYSYLGLIYNYMSGLIIGISVLFIVIGGIQIATSGGSEEGMNKGKSRIIKAIAGIIIWFTASIILYTINPTFFAF